MGQVPLGQLMVPQHLLPVVQARPATKSHLMPAGQLPPWHSVLPGQLGDPLLLQVASLYSPLLLSAQQSELPQHCWQPELLVVLVRQVWGTRVTWLGHTPGSGSGAGAGAGSGAAAVAPCAACWSSVWNGC